MDAETQPGMDGDGGAAADAPPDATMLSADQLPPGAKPGDKLVLGQPDDSGMFPVTLESAPNRANDAEEKQTWEDDLRKHMSPMMGDET